MLVGLLDVPLVVGFGVLSAVLYRRVLYSRNRNWYLFLTGIVVGLVWLNVVSANVTGIAYWALGVPTTNLTFVTGSFFVLSYPLWFRGAAELTFVLVGRRPDQGGVVWVFRLSDRTEPIVPAWRSNEVAEDIDVDQE